MPESTTSAVFRPRARMLLLLGDQLIRDAGLAVFELVKNSYDADATECSVRMLNVDEGETGQIIVEDNGSGMDRETVKSVWLEPGTEHRAQQKLHEKRSPKFGRLPLGEKGVGRFAVHKLGRVIKLVTRQRNKPEVVVDIDWKAFETGKYLADVPVQIRTRHPLVFTGSKSGTRIEITELRDGAWSKRKVRDLQRSITSICSPFAEPEDFRASLTLEPESDWLDGLTDIHTVLKQALFRATATLNGGTLSYSYEFRPLPGMKNRIEGRKDSKSGIALMKLGSKTEVLDLAKWNIGKAKLDLRIFDREPAVLDLTTSDKAGLKKFLDQNGGIRIYRDGIRVFDFGEPGNDWLDLGGRRVNIPTLRISNNQVIGAVHLDAADSKELIEKTNREGFIENDAYEAFQEAILFAVSQIEAERRIDKTRLRKIYSRGKTKEPVLDDLTELRSELKKRRLEKDLGKYIDRVEVQFAEVRDRLMTAAGAGLTLTTVIHEVEKIIKEVVSAVKKRAPRQRVETLVEHLASMVDGLSFLVRKSGKEKEKATVLIDQAAFNVEYRLKAHKIRLINGIEKGMPDFQVRCVRRLVVSTLMNLIDNSIYWLESKGAEDKQIFLGTAMIGDRPGIVVADNGPGFTDSPEYLVEPFFTRKPDGMGLGLHLANEVAKLHGGILEFPDAEDLSLPKQFDGAVVVLQFSENV